MATRWGCLGPGRIAHDFFLSIRENLPPDEHKFVAVASRDLGRAETFVQEFKFQKAYGSYDEIAKDPDVEVVYIATLHTTHAELSIKLLEAGKHVICEKPMAVNWKQAQKVLQVAKEQKRLFIEACWSKFIPSYEHIRKELRSGVLGDVKYVHATFCIDIHNVERISKPEMAGGGVLDIGVYVIMFACFVFREMPESITVVGNMTETGVDENACILLKYKNGAMASLTYHTNAGCGNNTATIMGPEGLIEVQTPFWAATKLSSPSGSHEFPLKKGDYKFINAAALHYEAAAVRQCILNGETESNLHSHEDIEMIFKILDEVRRQVGMKIPQDDE